GPVRARRRPRAAAALALGPRRRRAVGAADAPGRRRRRALDRRPAGAAGLRRLVRAAACADGGRLMDLGLRDRVALVTRASKGIGRGIAAGLIAEGAGVAIASRSASEAASEIGARGYSFDSNDLDAVPGLISAVEGDLGPIDIYIANTGGPPGGQDPLG